MKKVVYTMLVLIIMAGAAFLLWHKMQPATNLPPIAISNPPVAIPTPSGLTENNQPPNSPVPAAMNPDSFQPPLDRASERVTKKPFGIFITPQTSPVQPEKFHGYHTGADFEIFPEELKADVSVKAVCAGKLILKKYATGYGGVAVESCTLNNQPITVVYGHLKLASIVASAGDNLKVGDTLGILGAAYSSETDGERKHLHLGFHSGTSINILGYVQTKAALAGWLDPCGEVCHN